MKVRVDGLVWLPRRDLKPELIDYFREKLVVVPKKLGDFDEDVDPKPILLYQETPTEFGVPRAWWFKNAKGDEYEYDWQFSEGEPTRLLSKIRHDGPYAEQGEAVEFLEARYGEAKTGFPSPQERGLQLGGILQGKTGFGKCLGLGTPVLLFDGRVVAVEDVQDGDLLMGPDSRPRRVLSTNRGRGPLFRVNPVKGESWVCNDVHILTLVHTTTGEVIDIPLDEYLKKNKTFRNRHKLFQPSGGMEFEPSGEDLTVTPYFLGVWIGDGTKNLHAVQVTKLDVEVERACGDEAKKWGCSLRVDEPENRCKGYRIVNQSPKPNPLLDELRRLFADGIRIPRHYLVASRADRLELLAGLLDTDGSLHSQDHRCFEFSTRYEGVARDMEHLCRGLGLRVVSTVRIIKGRPYQRLSIVGETHLIPTRIPRKQAKVRRQKKNPLRTGFSVEAIGEGEYAGFTLDGDGRFLLGNFTVTHNTNTALALFERLQTTALVIVHKEFLLKQWVNRIKKFMPGTKVGIVREDKCEFKGMDIVIAMAQSLALDDGTGARYPKELYSWPGIVALDEVHRSGAPTWAPLPMRFTSMFRLGLTATPRRKDGCDRVFWDHIGDVVFEAKTEMPEPSIRMFYIKLGNLLPQLQDRDTKSPIVINILTYSRDRTDIIVDEIAHALKSPAQRKIMVLSHRLEHLARLRARLVERPEAQGVTTDFYVGEWFTGDTIPALKKGQWKMDDEGREKAIRTIYSSLSRRKEFRGAIEKREVTEPFIGPLLEGEEKRPLVPVLNEKGNPVREKIRTVWMDASDFNNFVDKNDDYLFEESYVTNDPEEELKTKVIIDDLQDVHLFSIARDWNIKQKKTVKKKPRTDEELFEAERARVMFCTYQMCAEGIDIPAVDTMTFATPSSDVEQAIGRGRRFCIPVRHGGLMEPEDCEHFCPWRHETCEGKAQLVVSDICDKGVPIAEGREYWRRQYYRREGFKVSGS